MPLHDRPDDATTGRLTPEVKHRELRVELPAVG
jgi:hypothetical protein